ncbi:hypothetical protein [Propionivibrio sp.]|uniref:hypothetical protein n=1 Tax=Propionivibrio sp. TaxID=2212460 RepID=UPI003BF13B3A
MVNKLASAILLTLKGGMYFTLALVDWLTATINVSERGYLLPFKVASEFHDAIVAAWHGQSRPPSLLACTHWDRKVCGPSPREPGKFL